MSKIIGIIGIILGIALGLYVGVWLCFIGGIIGLIVALGTLITGGGIAIGLISFSILKIVLAGFLGYLSGIIIILPSWVLFTKN